MMKCNRVENESLDSDISLDFKCKMYFLRHTRKVHLGGLYRDIDP